MSRPIKEKRRLCAKLSAQAARQLHGPDGDGCWDDNRCHSRRDAYRHRDRRNHQRRQQRQQYNIDQYQELLTAAMADAGVATLTLPAPAVPAAIAHFYRQTKDSPLHALGAELWLGNDRVAKIEPVHCLGLTQLQVKQLLVHILDSFSSTVA